MKYSSSDSFILFFLQLDLVAVSISIGALMECASRRAGNVMEKWTAMMAQMKWNAVGSD